MELWSSGSRLEQTNISAMVMPEQRASRLPNIPPGVSWSRKKRAMPAITTPTITSSRRLYRA